MLAITRQIHLKELWVASTWYSAERLGLLCSPVSYLRVAHFSALTRTYNELLHFEPTKLIFNIEISYLWKPLLHIILFHSDVLLAEITILKEAEVACPRPSRFIKRKVSLLESLEIPETIRSSFFSLLPTAKVLD